MTDFWLGVLAAFATVGGLVAALGIIWLVAVSLPRGVWWTVKRLPLDGPEGRDRAASVVAASRRAYVLRIPFGVRIIAAFGGAVSDQSAFLSDLRAARCLCSDCEDTESEERP